MPRLAEWARTQGDKPACYFPDTGTTVTYAQLHAHADQAARWLVHAGLRPGDAFAILMENHPAIFELAFAGRRAGLYWVPLNAHLKPHELAYILQDSGARLLVASAEQAAAATEAAAGLDIPVFIVGSSYDEALATSHPPIPPGPVGRDLLYSSGTTGFPKGVHRPLLTPEDAARPRPASGSLSSFGCDQDTVYLSPAPLYHAAPHRFTLHAIECGGTCIVVRRFDPAQTLHLIARHRVTHAQFVPIMFIRLLALPEATRQAADCSSLRRVIHAAAPCPIPVKRAMIAWWGPIIYEYYSGSETIGSTGIESDDWLLHPGSVGRPTLGTIHITGDDGHELPPGEIGAIRFSGTPRFQYLNAPEKTAAAYDTNGWATYGDIGWVDADGYLFLSDRRADLILSGGVNIYPQEVEDALTRHPDVADAAVIGVPDPEYGEQVRAVVQLRPSTTTGTTTTGTTTTGPTTTGPELVAFCRTQLAHLKCPRQVDIVDALPRSETGKLLRRVLKDQYRTRTG